MKYDLSPKPKTAHDLAVALGIEDDKHTTGVLCTKITITDGKIVEFDKDTVFSKTAPLGDVAPDKVAIIKTWVES